jgi:hypothetical protein
MAEWRGVYTQCLTWQIWGGSSCLSFRLKMLKNEDPPRENPSLRRKAVPSNIPRSRRMRGLQLANRWVSRPGEPFAGLSKCSRGEGQKEASCAGQRAPTRTARAALGGLSALSV